MVFAAGTSADDTAIVLSNGYLYRLDADGQPDLAFGATVGKRSQPSTMRTSLISDPTVPSSLLAAIRLP